MVALFSRGGRVVRRGGQLPGDAHAVVVGGQQHLETAWRLGWWEGAEVKGQDGLRILISLVEMTHSATGWLR